MWHLSDENNDISMSYVSLLDVHNLGTDYTNTFFSFFHSDPLP